MTGQVRVPGGSRLLGIRFAAFRHSAVGQQAAPKVRVLRGPEAVRVYPRTSLSQSFDLIHRGRLTGVERPRAEEK